MTQFVIQIKNGEPYQHPISAENLAQAFPHVDINNLGSDFAVFIRSPRPTDPGVYKQTQFSYVWNNGVVEEIWEIVDVSPTEKQRLIDEARSVFQELNATGNFSAWTFEESTCSYRAPTPRPNDGKPYFWQGLTNSWVATPPYPDDGKAYKLNVDLAQWIEITS